MKFVKICWRSCNYRDLFLDELAWGHAYCSAKYINYHIEHTILALINHIIQCYPIDIILEKRCIKFIVLGGHTLGADT